MRSFATTSLVGAAVAAVATFSTGANAQIDPSLISGLSSNCAGGLIGLVTSSDISSCLALPYAVGALTSAGNTSSVVPGLNGYLSNNICGSSHTACTKAQLSNANNTLVQACGSDLSSNGGKNVPALVYYFINSYDRLRNAGCVQGADGQYCVIKDMYVLQNATNQPLTLSSVQTVLSNTTAQQGALQALAANKTAFCTDCTHGLYTVLTQNNPQPQLGAAVNQTCGDSFTNGQIPSSLKLTANGNSTSAGGSSSGSSGKSAAAGINVGAMAMVGSALAAVAAGFALL